MTSELRVTRMSFALKDFAKHQCFPCMWRRSCALGQNRALAKGNGLQFQKLPVDADVLGCWRPLVNSQSTIIMPIAMMISRLLQKKMMIAKFLLTAMMIAKLLQKIAKLLQKRCILRPLIIYALQQDDSRMTCWEAGISSISSVSKHLAADHSPFFSLFNSVCLRKGIQKIYIDSLQMFLGFLSLFWVSLFCLYTILTFSYVKFYSVGESIYESFFFTSIVYAYTFQKSSDTLSSWLSHQYSVFTAAVFLSGYI